MSKAALALIALVVLCFLGQSCSGLPSLQDPTPRLMKDSPVNEAPEDPGSEMANAAATTSDRPGPASGDPAFSGRLMVPPDYAFGRSFGYGQWDWGHRRGSAGTSMLIVLVLVLVAVVGMAIVLSKIRA